MKQILTLILLSVISFSSAQNIEENLLLHYPFDGNSEDISGNEYHADENEVIYVDDRNNNPESAIYFNGVDSYINFPNLAELKPDLPVSFAFWIKYEDLQYTNTELFNTSFEDDRSSGVYFNTEISTGNLAVNFGDGSPGYNPTTRRSYVTNIQAEIDNWIHVISIVESATEMKIYVNCRDFGGNYSGTGGNLFYSITPGSLGRRDRDLGVPANYFKGAIDSFRYWNKVLSSDEIQFYCDPNLNVGSAVFDLQIKLFPNPAYDYFKIASPVSFEQTQIFDLTGKLVFKGDYNEKQYINGLKSGIYTVSLISDEYVSRKKLVIK
ncbi:MAG: LamG-like jellyroll fold domain-containing protein [Flavobacteriaceae bacterium]